MPVISPMPLTIICAVGEIGVDIQAREYGGHAGARHRRAVLDHRAQAYQHAGDIGNRVKRAGLQFTQADAQVGADEVWGVEEWS